MKRALVLLVRLATRLFYRQERLGRAVPAGGPVLLVANHPNGLLDPALVLSVTERDVLFLGKEPLFRMPVVGWIVRSLGVVPVHRAQDGADTAQNAAAFAAVHAALERGGAVALFPEGRAHDEPSVQRLKTGAARMALGADPARSGEPRIVPVGLVYRRKQRFRSRVSLWVGEPVDGADLRALHRADERAAVLALTERIGAALEGVTVNVDAAEDLPLVELAERLWKPATGPARVERLAALARGARRLGERDPAAYERLRDRILGFRRLLRRLGLSPAAIDVEYAPGTVARFAARQALALLLLGPVALVGLAWWALPYQLVRAIVKLWRPEPVLSATVQVFGGCALLLPWHAALCALVGARFGWPAAAAAAVLLPACGLVGFALLDRVGAVATEARRFARYARARRLRAGLRRERDELAAELEALARTLAAERAG